MATKKETVEMTTIRPKDLAEELGVDGKVLRSYLRANFARPTEAKNTSWEIDSDTAKAVREHYAAKAAAKTKDADEA